MPCSDPIPTRAEQSYIDRRKANNRKAAELLCSSENHLQLMWALGSEYLAWLTEHQALDEERRRLGL